MNIFILDINIETNATYYIDSHVTCIQKELVQMISTNIHLLCKPQPFFKYLTKPTHVNHPCTSWMRTSVDNFNYSISLLEQLSIEHLFRYNHNNIHKSLQQFNKFYNHATQDFFDNELFNSINQKNLTPFIFVGHQSCSSNDIVSSYRNYYINFKSHLFKWKNRNIPYWINL